MSHPIYEEKQYLKVLWISAPLLAAFFIWQFTRGEFSAFSGLLNGSGSWLLPAFFILVIVIQLNFGMMKINVDEEYLRWQFGLLTLPTWKVALNDIADIEIVDLRWYEGYGIRLTTSGMLYRASGSQALRVVRKNGKSFRLSSTDPQRLLSYIQPRLNK
ncbi:hypothetical protein H8K32_15895 [Undibacterium jejuense]|uniref:Uncharacterized protein n=1 Tax=Undibacterium jejuense TaxID=1344949 RepID=A0A923HH19_9BURK|nr:hypothetical protein [Undibacterium jejuense]MBC3863589.1 hypothetical protein [Undibacterium jejuense]